MCQGWKSDTVSELLISGFFQIDSRWSDVFFCFASSSFFWLCTPKTQLAVRPSEKFSTAIGQTAVGPTAHCRRLGHLLFRRGVRYYKLTFRSTSPTKKNDLLFSFRDVWTNGTRNLKQPQNSWRHLYERSFALPQRVPPVFVSAFVFALIHT